MDYRFNHCACAHLENKCIRKRAEGIGSTCASSIMSRRTKLRHSAVEIKRKTNSSAAAAVARKRLATGSEYRPNFLKFLPRVGVVVTTAKWNATRSALLLACFLFLYASRRGASATGTTPAPPERYSGHTRLSNMMFNAPTVFTRYEESKRRSPSPSVKVVATSATGQRTQTESDQSRRRRNACHFDAAESKLTCSGVEDSTNDVENGQPSYTSGAPKSTTSGASISAATAGGARPTPTVMNMGDLEPTPSLSCWYSLLNREFTELPSEVSRELRTLKIEHFEFDRPLMLEQLLTKSSSTLKAAPSNSPGVAPIFPNLERLVLFRNSFDDAGRFNLSCVERPHGGATVGASSAHPGDDKQRDVGTSAAVKAGIVQLDKLRDFQLISNNLTVLPASALGLMPQLRTLVLRDNKLISLENNSFDVNHFLVNISMSGNNWSCQKMEWFLAWTRQRPLVALLDKSVTVCEHNDGKATGRTTFGNLIDLCPGNCSCRLVRALVEVDCRQKAFHSFPPVVPVNTSILHMENNSIASLESIVNGENYSKLRFFYVDNNFIDSLNILERTEFYNGLVALHISGNKLRRVPVYIISRLTDLRLGRNPWRCECDAVSSFYDFLMSRAKDIQDVDEIRCATDGSVIHRAASKHKFCYDDEGTIHLLDVLNSVLVFLILLVIVNVMYDYTIFQLTGRRPREPCCFNLVRNVCSVTYKPLSTTTV